MNQTTALHGANQQSTKRVKQKMPEVDDERAEVIRYGFELIIGEVPKMILIFLIAILIENLLHK